MNVVEFPLFSQNEEDFTAYFTRAVSESFGQSEGARMHSDYSPSSDDSEAEPDDDRRYPVRQRTARVIPGAIPWSAVRM